MYNQSSSYNPCYQDINSLKKIQDKVSKLDKLQQYEIFKIIKKYENKLTENKNGIFINLSCLSNECLSKINEFINFSIDNKKRLQDIELLSQNILKNSILNNQYEKFQLNKNNNNLKFKNDKIGNKNNKEVKEQMDKFVLNKSLPSQSSNINSQYDKYSINLNTTDPEISNEEEEANYNLLDSIKSTMSAKKESENQDLDQDNDIDYNDEDTKLSEKTNIPLRDQIKKVRYTGKKARLFKKCRESSKNICMNNITYYSSNDIENEDTPITNLQNELTEDKI